jgi:hypothetical protein
MSVSASLGMARGSFVRVLFGIIAAGIALTAIPAAARDLPRIDALSGAPTIAAAARDQQLQATGLVKERVNSDSRFGVPTFLWGRQTTAQASASVSPTLDATAAARAHLQNLGPLYGLSAAEANAAPVAYVQTLANGSAIVKFRNTVGGIEVFREEAAVLLDANRNLLAVGGYLMGNPAKGNILPASFKLSPAQAVAVALGSYAFDASVASQLQTVGAQGAYLHVAFPTAVTSSDGSQLAAPARVKQVLFRLPGRLLPAYYVETQVRDNVPDENGKSGNIDYYAFVVDATSGKILYRHNQTSDVAFNYRTFAELGGSNLPLPGPSGRNGFPHPTATPDGYQGPFVSPNIITLQNAPFSRNDPWLAPGTTITKGNNVDAFADLFPPDNFGPADAAQCDVLAPFTGDFHACTNAANTFDYTYDTAQDPQVNKTQVMASVVNLFYMNNWLHDWYYDSGFDEVSGNAQASNYGRGGLENDAIFAEGQDFASLNNANMATPSDGGQPRMRMYVFTGNGAAVVKVNAPAAIAGTKPLGTAAFGAAAFDVTNDVVYASPANGCTAIGGAVAGKIALIDRGTCGFVVKAKNAQVAGAVGVIIANNVDSIVNMAGVDPTVTIGTLSVKLSDGNAIKAQLALPATVNVRMARLDSIRRDGTLDNGVIAHEWGHYISNRLIADANGLGTNMSGGLGEGWADSHAMLLLVKATDAALPTNANFGGTYALAGYVEGGASLPPDALNQGFYYGIRRYPYSRDMTKNPLTFKYIEDGVPLPVSPPPAFGQDGSSNSEVHNTGEVWASMVWECYSNLLNATPRLSFDVAQSRMKGYMVAAYKMTPVNPTLVEARDALLAAMIAQDVQDYQACYTGFAKRGAGINAVSPDRFDPHNTGVIEDFLTGGALKFVGATLDDKPLYCDKDGVLDNGETGTLTVTLQNSGSTVLSATTATLSSTNPHISFPGGTTINFPPSAQTATTTATIPVRLTGASGIELADITINYNDPGLAVAGPQTAVATFRLNSDQLANSSATDDVESSHTVWTTGTQSTTSVFQRIQIAANDHRWLGPDDPIAGLTWLQSPPLQVAAGGNFSFTFKHRFDFEAAGPAQGYDGGQIQISTDGGTTWTDIGASAVPGYNGTIVNYSGDNNPLAGKPAYVINNAAFPAQETVTVSLGTAYAGQSVMVRFVIGSDDGGGGGGWEIDDIAFTNITNTPFDTLVPNAGACVVAASQAGTPQSAAINTAYPVNLAVLLKDAGNNPLPGVAVTFNSPGSGASGSFSGPAIANTPTGSSVTVNTNASGIATAPTFTANGTLGTFNVTATAGLQSATFVLTNTVGAAASVTSTGGSPQSTVISTAFAQTLQATVKDASSNPIPGAMVAFALPALGASGTFAGGGTTVNAVTNASGVATSPVITANATAGAYSATATVSGVGTPASFSLSNTTGAVTSLSLVGGSGQTTRVGTAFAVPLVVLAKDGGGNPVAGAAVTWTGPTLGASATTSSGSTPTDATGKATITATANGIAGAYNMVAQTGALTVNLGLTNTTTVTAGNSCLMPNLTVNDLVEQNYQALLRRASDASGAAFWESEAARICLLGVDPKQTFVVMGNVFVNSPEYVAFGRTDSAFVTDLYVAFFGRLPDAGGLTYWTGQLTAGLPRNLVLNSFLFGPEYTATMQSVFGSGTFRAEVYAIVDLYGGFFRRLPDNFGYVYWDGQFRTAQCQANPAVAVQNAMNQISSQFLTSAEYVARARTNSEYISDLYYTMLRRGGDLAGYNFWLGKLDSNALTRDQVRLQFLASPEMQARLAAIAVQGCLP